LLESVRDEEGNHHLEGDHEGPADQDDELQLVDPLDNLVHPGFHHDAGHFEVEVEEGDQEQHDDQRVEAQADHIEHVVGDGVDVEDDEGDEEGDGGYDLHGLQPGGYIFGLFLT